MSAILASIVAFILLVLARLAYNYLRLSKIPGPFLAGCSNLWRAYYQHRGELRAKIIQLHEKHGSVVRYGVNMVSITDSSAVPQIYLGKGFTIHDSYRVILGIKDGKEVESLVTVRDETKHGQMRRSIASAFTPTAALELESLIDTTILTLLQVLSGRKEVDIANQIFWYSLDNAGQMTFGEDVGCLRTDSDTQYAGKMIRSRFEHWGYWGALPELERLIFRNPIAMFLPQGQPATFVGNAARRYRSRVTNEKDSGSNDLLQKFIEARQKYPDFLDAQGLMGLVMSTISGAADTTASTLTGILYFLITHPSCCEKLERELINANVTLPIPKFTETRHLAYLDAVIKEGMRLFSVVNWPMERRVPAGGMHLTDYFFPEGTSVGVLPAALHMNRWVFGEDVKEFRPDRWLEGDVEKTRRMEANFLGFSKGKRVCLGQNIAVLQMKKVVPAMVLKFKMVLADKTQTLDADYSPAVIMVKPLHVRLASKD